MRGSTSGLPGETQGFNTSYYKFLTIVDMLISILIVSPAVVGYWRSAWMLMDIHVLPSDTLMSAIVSTVIGVFGHMFFSISGNLFTQYFHPNKNRILYYVVSRSYTVCYAFVCVNGWRGPWSLLDMHSKNSIFISTLVGVIALIVIRGLRNVTASPCVIATDGAKGYFDTVTMFRISVSRYFSELSYEKLELHYTGLDENLDPSKYLYYDCFNLDEKKLMLRRMMDTTRLLLDRSEVWLGVESK